MIGKPQFSLIDNDTPMVTVTIGNKTYPPITVEKDKELIDKANKYKELTTYAVDHKLPTPRQFLYCLWVTIYQDSGYDFYLDPINMRLFESKWKRAISNFISSWRRNKKGKKCQNQKHIIINK